jgi:phage terminase Nu1 subunit (DNA packaging protein)
MAERDEQKLLDHFDLVTEEQLATILGISVRTLKNRPHAGLPRFTKRGRRRLFQGESVREWLQPQ